MFKTLKVFTDRHSKIISIIGPRRRSGRVFEVVSWTGFDASDITSFDEKLRYAHLFAKAPELRAAASYAEQVLVAVAAGEVSDGTVADAIAKVRAALSDKTGEPENG